MKLGFIGTGKLASAILRGVCASGKVGSGDIIIYDINSAVVDSLTAELGVKAGSSAAEVASSAEYVFVAVKPKDIPSLIGSIAAEGREHDPVFISTAAGTQLSRLKELFGYDVRAVRIMPNINAAVGEAMTAVCPDEFVTKKQADFVLGLCGCFGRAIMLDEKYFSVFTAVAGSAPAFAYLFADALAVAGIKYGMTAAEARETAAQMLYGSAKMLLESPLSADELIKNVCSPAGTTVEGLCSLKKTGFEASVITAVEETVEKDRRMAAQ